METELAAACTLLQAEFPDVPRAVLEAALREVELDIPAARRKLLSSQTMSRGPSDPFRAATSSRFDENPSSPDNSWFSSNGWNQGMRDLGLESIGAQLSLLGKQVASSLNSILPTDLNPFAFDEEDYDDDELAAAAAMKAKQDEREKASAAVAASAARKLNNRRGGPRSPGGRFTTDEEEEEEEEEDTDKLN